MGIVLPDLEGVLNDIGQKTSPASIPCFIGAVCLVLSLDSLINMYALVYFFSTPAKEIFSQMRNHYGGCQISANTKSYYNGKMI